MSALINTYTGGGLLPAQDSTGAQTDAINLAAGKAYTQGQALGQVEGTGTAVNEVQTMTGTGTLSGGTYVLQYNGETTAAIAYNANNATIQAALEALPSIGVGGCTVGGGAFPGTPATFTFAGAGTTAGLHQALLNIISSITGGGTVAIALTTLGKPAGGYWDVYNDAASGVTAGLSTARRLLKHTSYVDSNGRIFMGTTLGAANHGNYDRTAASYHAGTFRASDIPNLDANGVADLGKLISGSTSTLSSPTTLLRMG